MSHLIVATFDRADEAGELRRGLGRLERAGQLDLEDAAVVVKEADGQVHIKNEPEMGMRAGAYNGAFAGLILGLLFPPAGLAASVAGGALAGSGLARWLGEGVEPAFVEEVSVSLRPGTSALLVVVNAANPEAALAALRPYRGTLRHTTLDPDAEAALRQALEGPA